MSIARSKTRFSFQFVCVVLVVSLLGAFLPACSPQPQPVPTATGVEVEETPTSQVVIEPTPDPIPELPPFDATALLFEEGNAMRDENCSRVFGFHKTSYGPLTIVIADNLVEPRDPQELAAEVVDLYSDLYNASPVPMSHAPTVTILSNPNVGECYSAGDLVFVSPDELDSRSFSEDLLGAATGIGEYWVLAGLSSLALDEQPDNEKLRTWYQTTDDLDMAGLFIARFMESWATEEGREIARMSATSLVQYALEVEEIQPDALVEEVDNGVRTRWLEWLGVDRTVTYPYDGYFAGYLYSQRSECELFVKTDTMYFCLNRIPSQEYFDEISEAEFLIYNAYYGRKALVEYLLSEAPSVSHLMNPEETITIEVVELGARLGYAQGNTITLNKSAVYYDVLHEIVHTFEWNSTFNNDTLWMSEGFAEYLGTLLTVYPQTAKGVVFTDLSGHVNEGDSSNFPGTSYWYYLDPEQFEAAKAWYLAQGGQMEDEESVNPRLYADAVAFATMYRDAYAGSRGLPMGVKYELLVSGFHYEGQDGMELSYTTAASFIAWLCDTYSLDRVMDVYVNHAEDGMLDGKGYAELKADWLADLIAKGQGIDIPGAPWR